MKTFNASESKRDLRTQAECGQASRPSAAAPLPAGSPAWNYEPLYVLDRMATP